jgi:hypothetical protein
LSKGVLEKPRTFRNVDFGNSRVKQYAEDLNSGQDSLEFAELQDLVSLLVKWCRDLPVPIIGEELMPNLRNAYDDGRFIDFVEGLTLPFHLTLRYLTGFIRDVVDEREITKMSANDMAELFAPMVVSVGHVADSVAGRRYRDIAVRLFVFLIEKWNTADIYPLDPEILVMNSSEVQ